MDSPSAHDSTPRPDHGDGSNPTGDPSTAPPDAPSGSESPLRTVGVAAGLGVLGIVGLLVTTVVVALFGRSLGLPTAVLFVGGMALGQYVGFVGLGLAYLRRRGFDAADVRRYVGIQLPTLRDLGVVVAGYLAIVALFVVVGLVALRFLPEPAQNEGAAFFAGNPELIPVGVAVMFLVVGPAEEFLYRGIVQNRLRERLSGPVAVGIASVIFASVHVIALAGDPSGVAVTVLILFVPGIVLGAVYEYTGNLVVPWLLHSTHNSVLLTLVFFAPEEAAALLAAAGL